MNGIGSVSYPTQKTINVTRELEGYGEPGIVTMRKVLNLI